MKQEYKNIVCTYEIVANNVHKLNFRDAKSNNESFVIETHKLGIFDDDTHLKFDAVLEWSDAVDQELMARSVYVSRGICMYDKDPIVISFGGLIGKFNHVNVKIDKDVDRIAYFYLILHS
jgi:hypothetical protein